MAKYESLNELNLKITQGDKTLIDELCCTAVTVALNNDGEVFTSFVGNYNAEILKLLKNVHKTYYKNLLKKLKHKQKEEGSEKTKPETEETKSETKTENSNKTNTNKKSKTKNQPKQTKNNR